MLVLEQRGQARPLAEALVRGGLPVLEVTLRTPVALDAIRAMREVEGSVVGAGTVLTEQDVRAVKAAGADFIVSPGATERLLKAAQDAGLPLLPGAATGSEVMYLLEQGLDVLKLFPAEAVGGMALLRSLHGPLPQVSFCPTGGIGAGNAAAYLALPNVVCVGGSWVAPRAMLEAGDWAGIEQLAHDCQQLRNGRQA